MTDNELISLTPKIWCDNCLKNTIHYTKIFGLINVTYCKICNEKTEWET